MVFLVKSLQNENFSHRITKLWSHENIYMVTLSHDQILLATDGLTDRSTNRLTDRLTDRLTNRLTNQPTNWPINQPTDQLTDWPANWPTDLQADQEMGRWTDGWTDRQRDRRMDGPTDWLADQLTDWPINQPNNLAMYLYLYLSLYLHVCLCILKNDGVSSSGFFNNFEDSFFQRVEKKKCFTKNLQQLHLLRLHSLPFIEENFFLTSLCIMYMITTKLVRLFRSTPNLFG